MRKVYELIPGDGPRRLDFLMSDQGVTASGLAKAAGYDSHSYIARMRKGNDLARRVRKESGDAIAQHLGCQPDYLFVEVVGRGTRAKRVTEKSQTPVMETAA